MPMGPWSIGHYGVLLVLCELSLNVKTQWEISCYLTVENEGNMYGLTWEFPVFPDLVAISSLSKDAENLRWQASLPMFSMQVFDDIPLRHNIWERERNIIPLSFQEEEKLLFS